MRGLDDRGSILPLAIGYVLLGLAIALVSINAISLFVAQKQLDALADATALAASDGFEILTNDNGVAIRLDLAEARGHADEVMAASTIDATIDALDTIGDQTARVRLTAAWEPFLATILVPDGVTLTSTATSRAALAG